VGQLLDLLDELGITENTIVVYTTDNGPHYNEWPDGGISAFRGEKNTNWEGGFRVPAMVRWPGKFPAGRFSNEIMSAQDWLPTLMAAVGDPDIKGKLLKGHKAAGKNFKVHLDGYDFLPVGLRVNQWKLVFMEQRKHFFDVWAEPFVSLRIPKIFNLRSDPYERADTDSNNYRTWWIRHAFLLVPAQDYVGRFISTFQEFPPRQKPAKFNMDEVMRNMQEGATH
jgi:arylsulfatase